MKNLADKPFALLGVNGNDYPPPKLKQVMDKEKLNWRSFTDHHDIFPKWVTRGTPTYYVIDHKGVIRSKWFGYPGTKTLDTALEKLIKEAESQSSPK